MNELSPHLYWSWPGLTSQTLRQEEAREVGSSISASSSSSLTQRLAISVLMPAFNEETNIRPTLEMVSKAVVGAGLDYEIVVIDDGSTDRTRQIAAEEMNSLPVKVVGYGLNLGKGQALKYGTKFASGDITVFLDCDGEINPLDLVEYLMALRNSDLAIGSKRHPNSRVTSSTERKLLSVCFNYLVRILTGINYSDTQSGLKAFKTSSLKRIMPLVSVKKYAFDVEILTVASLMKMKVVELPVTIRLSAPFKIKNVLRMFIDLLGIAYRRRILRWYRRNLNNLSAEYRPILRW